MPEENKADKESRFKGLMVVVWGSRRAALTIKSIGHSQTYVPDLFCLSFCNRSGRAVFALLSNTLSVGGSKKKKVYLHFIFALFKLLFIAVARPYQWPNGYSQTKGSARPPDNPLDSIVLTVSFPYSRRIQIIRRYPIHLLQDLQFKM